MVSSLHHGLVLMFNMTVLKVTEQTFTLLQKNTYKYTVFFNQKYKNNRGSTTVFNIGMVTRIIFSCAQNLHIRMISEGSCDTEDWSNGY